MGYCRFENTLEDLEDCHEHLFDNDLSKRESEKRIRLILLCAEIASNFGDFYALTKEEIEEIFE